MNTLCYALIVATVIANDANKTFAEMADEYGFKSEEHEVITDDGYILKVLRIPGLKNDNSINKPPVFMQHGIFANGECFTINHPDVAPAYVAARAGYDIWLGNSRGNNYSTGHTHLDPNKDSKQYWNFGWEEMGTLDLKAALNHVTETTGQSKVAYIGHSQGTA